MTNLIRNVRKFMRAAGDTTDHYNVRQTALYIGMQLEEMAEKLEAIPFAPDFLRQNIINLYVLSEDFKSGSYDNELKYASQTGLLSADIYLAWATIGSTLSQGANVEGACREVASANMSKLMKCKICEGSEPVTMNNDFSIDRCEECNGLGLVPVKDKYGKVKTPAGILPPDVRQYVFKKIPSPSNAQMS